MTTMSLGYTVREFATEGNAHADLAFLITSASWTSYDAYRPGQVISKRLARSAERSCRWSSGPLRIIGWAGRQGPSPFVLHGSGLRVRPYQELGSTTRLRWAP